MSSEYQSLEELCPNCVVIFKTSSHNRSNLAALLTNPPNERQGISFAFEKGYKRDTAYCFLRILDQESRHYIQDVVAKLGFVESVLPLYDQRRQKLLQSYFKESTQFNNLFTFPSDIELNKLAKLTNNAEVSLYLAFFKYYNHFLGYLSIFGVTVNFFSGSEAWQFNKLYSIVCICWSIAFVTSWLYHTEPTYAVDFARFQNQQLKRVNGDSSSETTVLLKKLGFIPAAVLFGGLLLLWQLLCFFVEIFFTQVYDGPLKMILSLVPTVMFSGFNAGLTFVYNKFFVDPYVKYERSVNPTKSKFEKNFVLKAIAGYAPLLITLFLYYPFGYMFTPERREILAWSRLPLISGDFIVNVNRHQKQFFYFIVTNQAVLLALDNLVPLILQRVMTRFVTSDSDKENVVKVQKAIKDSKYPENLALWETVKDYESAPIMTPFDVDSNYQNLLLEFGYLTMFSAIWPLAPLITYLINFIILKINIWRITKKSRPTYIPGVTNDSPMMLGLAITTTGAANVSNGNTPEISSLVEPWDDILKFVVFIGSIVMPALTYMYQYCYIPGIGISAFISATLRSTWYRTSPLAHSWGSILLVAVICEHLSFVLYYLMKKYYTEVTGSTFAVNTILHPELNTMNIPTVHDDEIESLAEEVGNGDYTIANDATSATTDLSNGHDKQSEQIQEKQTVVTEESSSVSLTTSEAHDAEKPQPSTNEKNGGDLTGDDVTENRDNSGKAENGISNPVSDANGEDEDDEPIQEEEDNEETKVSQLSGRELKMKMDLRKISSIDLIPPITDTNLLGNAPSDVAGATLPTTIPTSKNYNARINADDVGGKEDVSTKKKPEATSPPQTVAATKSDLEPAVKGEVSAPDSPVKPLDVPKQRSGNNKTALKNPPAPMKPEDEKTVQQPAVSSSTTKIPVNEAIHDVGKGGSNSSSSSSSSNNNVELTEPTKVSGSQVAHTADSGNEGKADEKKEKEDATSSGPAYPNDTRSDSIASSTASAPATPTSLEFIDKQQLTVAQALQVTGSETQGQLQKPDSLEFQEHPDAHHHHPHHHHGRFASKPKAKVQSMLSKTRSNEEDKTLKKAKKKSLLSKLKGKI